MYNKRREEKSPTPNALVVEPAIVYNDTMDFADRFKMGLSFNSSPPR
jgi:hypothetical protein